MMLKQPAPLHFKSNYTALYSLILTHTLALIFFSLELHIFILTTDRDYY